MKQTAFAKINLTLEILGKNRPDGFHDIKSVMHKINLGDEIEIVPRNDGKINLECSDKTLCSTEQNLAYKAAKAYFDEYERIFGKRVGADITVTKHTPSGAGLGGGSADAACVIDMLLKLFPGVSDEKCDELCALLGSDVVFCREKYTCALCTGRGEIVTKVSGLPECFILIAKPIESLNTAGIYSEYDKKFSDDYSKNLSDKLVLTLSEGCLYDICSHLVNDFEPICIPRLSQIQDIKNKMLSFKALASQMSGSGSAVFGIFDSREKRDLCKYELDKMSVLTFI